ncbi:hypothetical protein MHYP_G00262150 [Metynnis hypsauchen]
MGLCRTLVTTFSQSWQKKRKLQKEQTELNLPQQCLVLDCPTRTTKRMLDDRRSQHLNPTWQDVKVLESVNAVLKKAADFTDALSSEKTVTASSVKPVLEYKDINPVDDVKDVLLEEMLAVPEEHRDDGDGAMRASMAGEGEGTSAPAPAPKKMKLADLLGKRKKTLSPVPRRIRTDTELARHLQAEALDSHSDPLAR